MISVYGSANMDLVAYVGTAPKPGETITGRAFRTIPGGKGANQAIAAARAGGQVAFIGAVGDDAFGPEMRAALTAAGINATHLRTVEGASGIAHIVVADGGENAIVIVPGANGMLTGPSETEAAAISRTEALLLQLELPIEAVIAAAQAAKAARRDVAAGLGRDIGSDTGRDGSGGGRGGGSGLGPGDERGDRSGLGFDAGGRTGAEVVDDLSVSVILTPAPARELPRELLDAVDLIVPNQHEAAAITGLADPERALRALLELVPEVVITLGSAGALYGSRDTEPLRVPAVRVKAIDTTAAGDTFVGALAVARTEGQPPEEALRFASTAAALSVQREGASTSMPTRAEIEEALWKP